MAFQKINYKELNGRQKEVYNFHKIAAVLADYGFNCLKLTDDWQGADFLAYQMTGDGKENTLKVQLKSRVTISLKYLGKNIWIAFPRGEEWFLIQHDDLIEHIRKTTNWLNTASWKFKGEYSSDSPGGRLLASIAGAKL